MVFLFSPVDGDGDLDFITTTRGSSSVSQSRRVFYAMNLVPSLLRFYPIVTVLSQTPSGPVPPPPPLIARIMDVNRDGLSDIYISNGITAQQFYTDSLRMSDMSFLSPPMSYTLPVALGNIVDISAINVAGGAYKYPVLATSSATANNAVTIINNTVVGLGALNALGPFGGLGNSYRQIVSGATSASALYVQDFTGDGFEELIAVVASPSATSNLYFSASNTDKSLAMTGTTISIALYSSVATADWTGDLKADAFFGTSSGTVVMHPWLNPPPPPAPPSPQQFNVNAVIMCANCTSPGVPILVAAGDVDNNCYGDFVASYSSVGTIEYFRRLSSTVSAPSRLFVTPASGSTVTDLALAYMDNDCFLDVVWSDGAGIRYALYNSATMSFSAPNLVTSTTVADFDTADIDGDGDMDVVAAISTLALVNAYLQTAPGVFVAAPEALVRGLTNAAAVKAVDMNGDGRLDVLAGGSAEMTLSYNYAYPVPPAPPACPCVPPLGTPSPPPSPPSPATGGGSTSAGTGGPAPPPPPPPNSSGSSPSTSPSNSAAKKRTLSIIIAVVVVAALLLALGLAALGRWMINKRNASPKPSKAGNTDVALSNTDWAKP